MKTKRKAEAQAKKLLAKMKSPGWKIDVWENMGWHYCLRNGVLTINPSSVFPGTFLCLIGDGKSSGGLSICTPMSAIRNKDPNKAIREQTEFAKSAINKYQAIIKKAEKIISTKR